MVDPKAFAPEQLRRSQDRLCIIPPNSFALARTVEYFRIPRDVLVICLGKSHLRALRHHRERHAAGAGMGRPGDAGNPQHHPAARQDLRQRRHRVSSCSCKATNPARSATPTKPANTCDSAASRCRGCEAGGGRETKQGQGALPPGPPPGDGRSPGPLPGGSLCAGGGAGGGAAAGLDGAVRRPPAPPRRHPRHPRTQGTNKWVPRAPPLAGVRGQRPLALLAFPPAKAPI